MLKQFQMVNDSIDINPCGCLLPPTSWSPHLEEFADKHGPDPTWRIIMAFHRTERRTNLLSVAVGRWPILPHGWR